MKKLLLALGLLLAGATTSFAQDKGKVAIGAAASYEFDASSLAIGAKARYGITDNIRLDAGINYFLPKSYGIFSSSRLDISANAHYVFTLSDKFKVYPLAGLGYYRSIISGSLASLSSGVFAANVGGGVSYELSSKLSLGAEAKVVLRTGSMTVVGVNLMYAL